MDYLKFDVEGKKTRDRVEVGRKNYNQTCPLYEVDVSLVIQLVPLATRGDLAYPVAFT